MPDEIAPSLTLRPWALGLTSHTVFTAEKDWSETELLRVIGLIG
jgi:hypothetical protein